MKTNKKVDNVILPKHVRDDDRLQERNGKRNTVQFRYAHLVARKIQDQMMRHEYFTLHVIIKTNWFVKLPMGNARVITTLLLRVKLFKIDT